MDIDPQIDDWVRCVNQAPRHPLYDDEAPASVVVGEPQDDDGYITWDWSIKRWPNISWLDAMEAQLPTRFPPSFRSLVSRYIFPEFDWAGITFLANTPEGIAPLHELRSVILEDEDLAGFLLARGYLTFARPDTGDFDLICFDATQPKCKSEFPIVRIDHESVFIGEKIVVTETLARDFLQLITLA